MKRTLALVAYIIFGLIALYISSQILKELPELIHDMLSIDYEIGILINIPIVLTLTILITNKIFYLLFKNKFPSTKKDKIARPVFFILFIIIILQGIMTHSMNIVLDDTNSGPCESPDCLYYGEDYIP